MAHRRAQHLRRTLISSLLPDPTDTDIQFVNVHDVSWGTKGKNKVSTSKDKNEVEVMVPTEDVDINGI